jgi:predicted HTH domain antitoxin
MKDDSAKKAQEEWRAKKGVEAVDRDSTVDAIRKTYTTQKLEDREDYKPRKDTGGFSVTDPEYKLWKKWKKEAKKNKFPIGALLDEWLQARVNIHRINQIEGGMTAKTFLSDKDWVQARQRAHERVLKAEKELQVYANKDAEKRDAVELLDEYQNKAKEFIKSHAGEFTVLAKLKCPSCSTQVKELVGTDGLPFWACVWEKNSDGEVIYLKWSKEILWLYEQGQLSLGQAAFILRTSPRGIMYTAQRRGELLKESDLQEAEEEILKLREDSGWPNISSTKAPTQQPKT